MTQLDAFGYPAISEISLKVEIEEAQREMHILTLSEKQLREIDPPAHRCRTIADCLDIIHQQMMTLHNRLDRLQMQMREAERHAARNR